MHRLLHYIQNPTIDETLGARNYIENSQSVEYFTPCWHIFLNIDKHTVIAVSLRARYLIQVVAGGAILVRRIFRGRCIEFRVVCGKLNMRIGGRNIAADIVSSEKIERCLIDAIDNMFDYFVGHTDR